MRLHDVVAGYPRDFNVSVKKSCGDCTMLFLHRIAADDDDDSVADEVVAATASRDGGGAAAWGFDCCNSCCACCRLCIESSLRWDDDGGAEVLLEKMLSIIIDVVSSVATSCDTSQSQLTLLFIDDVAVEADEVVVVNTSCDEVGLPIIDSSIR